MTWGDEEWESSSTTGRRARIAGVVLLAVFVSVPLFSLLSGIGSVGRLGPLLMGVLVLAVIAGLYALVARWLRGPRGRARDDDEFWF